MERPVDQWGGILVYIITSKSDLESFRLWEQLQKRRNSKFPTIDRISRPASASTSNRAIEQSKKSASTREEK
jgi:hypothetical protein